MSTATRRILVVRPDRIGDVVLSTPVIHALRSTWPDAHIVELVRPYTADILHGNPHLNAVIEDDASFGSMVSRVRRHRFDTALLLLPSSRHSWMCMFAGVPRRVASSRKAYHWLTRTEVHTRDFTVLRHEADYCMDLARAIGANETALVGRIYLSESERRTGLDFLTPVHRPMIGIHPGSGGSAPNWSAGRYAELATTLLAELPTATIVLTGSAVEQHLEAPFASLPPHRVRNRIGRHGLRETAAVISILDVLVSASTGTMHMAAALGIPTVSLFCPTGACSPTLWGPLGNTASVVLPVDGFCGNRCPGDPHACTLDGGISTEVVRSAVLAALKTTRNGALRGDIRSV